MVTAWCASRPPGARSPPTTARYERKDRFYRKAREEGLRARGAYKLRDLLRKLPQVRSGAKVVELGCWPGSWLQVLADCVGPDGRVVGVDIEQTEPISGVEIVCGDFTEPAVVDAIAEALGGPADAVLSDAAPKLTGIRDVDGACLEELYEGALRIAERLLRPEGALVVKGFPGPEADAFRAALRQRFGQVSEVRPEGKRSSSREFYWVARPKPRSGSGGDRRRRRDRAS